MYGAWLSLTLLGKLVPHDGESIPHKHSMTGLNLSGGNGVLSYASEGSGKEKPVSGSPSGAPTAATCSSKYSAYAYAVGIVQRNLSGSSGTVQQAVLQVQGSSPSGSGLALDCNSSDS